MKYVWNRAVEHRKSWWFSVLLNAAALLTLLLLMRPYFETNDDTTMCEFASGAKGGRDSHLVFIHILLGRLLRLLYTVLPSVPWYTVLQYAVLFAAFTVIAHVLFERFSMSFATVLFGTLYLFFAHQSYITIQFSRTAGIASCAGILLMFYGLEQEKHRMRIILPGILLALAGGMYRSKEFLLCAAPMSAIGLYALLSLDWKHPGKLLRPVFAYLGSFFLLFALFAGLQLYDAHCYAQDASWDSYLAFNDLRSNLLDYGLPDYNTYEEAYRQLGLSKKDVELFRSCNYADPEVFTGEVIETLTQLTTHKTLDSAFVKAYCRRFPLGFFRLAIFPCFLLICCYWLFWGSKGRKECTALLYELLVIGLLYLFLFYMGRTLIERTETALWLAASLPVIWLMNRQTDCFSLKTAAAFCSCVLVFNLESWQSDLHPVQHQTAIKMQEERQFLETIGKDVSHLYLTRLGTLTSFTAYGPFQSVPSGSLANICPLGGWEYGTPIMDSVLKRFAVTNPYRDMINNPQILVADSNVQATLDYLRAHYDPEVDAYEIKQIRNRHFYSFRSEPLLPDLSDVKPADERIFFSGETAWNTEGLTVRGLLYRSGSDSFSQLVYLRLTDTETKEALFFPVMTYAGRDRTDLLEGQYGGFLVTVPAGTTLSPNGTAHSKAAVFSEESLASGRFCLDLILETEDGIYLQPLESPLH